MKLLVLAAFLAVCTASAIQRQILGDTREDCHVPDLKKVYQDAIFDFTIPFYRAVALQTDASFVFGLSSVWIMLAAIAEGCNKEAQEELFRLLKVPKDSCLREKLYRIATTRYSSIGDGSVKNSRNFFIDENVNINPLWLDFVTKNALFNVVNSPIKSNPALSQRSGLNLTGNSVMLDTNGYNVLWTAPFAGAIIERSPFYNQQGEEIGSVDLMRVKRKARMGYVNSVNGKALELPIDSNGFYRMLIVIFFDTRNLTAIINQIKNSIVEEIFESLRESHELIDIAVPRIDVSQQLDMRAVVETLGAKSIWSDPEVTKYISTPPAFPTSYVQRTSVKVNEKGFTTPSLHFSTPGCASGLDPRVGTDFIANKPFLLGLFDAETHTPLVGVGFPNPTYPKE